jgi:hypothetical protein
MAVSSVSKLVARPETRRAAPGRWRSLAGSSGRPCRSTARNTPWSCESGLTVPRDRPASRSARALPASSVPLGSVDSHQSIGPETLRLLATDGFLLDGLMHIAQVGTAPGMGVAVTVVPHTGNACLLVGGLALGAVVGASFGVPLASRSSSAPIVLASRRDTTTMRSVPPGSVRALGTFLPARWRPNPCLPRPSDGLPTRQMVDRRPRSEPRSSSPAVPSTGPKQGSVTVATVNSGRRTAPRTCAMAGWREARPCFPSSQLLLRSCGRHQQG